MAKKRKETDEEKAYEVKDKRRVNADGSLKNEVESPKSEVGSPEAEQPAAEQAGEPVERAEPAEKPSGEEAPAGEMPQFDLGQLAMAWLSTLDTLDLLQVLIGRLSDKAWQHMGVRLAPGEKEPAKDMVKAKLAIDMVVYIGDKISPQVDEDTRRAIRGLITDLQLNFVQRGQ